MAEQSSSRRIQHTDADGRPLATADIEVDSPSDLHAEPQVDSQGSTAVAAFHVESGHRPPGASAQLIDEVVDSREVRDADSVVAIVPRGEAELLEEIQQRLADPSTRAAGASVIVRGNLPDTPAS